MSRRRAARLDPLEPAPGGPSAAGAVPGVAVVSRADAASALCDGTRRTVLTALREPGSATSIATNLGLSRQLANYHVRALERAGLVEEIARRRRRGVTERIVRATASHYLISPAAIGPLGQTSTETADRFSATYQVAVAARTIREVADLAARARQAGKRLTTLTLDSEVRFATPAAREAFATELVDLIQGLVARHHDGTTPDGRAYRLFVGAHPVFREDASQEDPV